MALARSSFLSFYAVGAGPLQSASRWCTPGSAPNYSRNTIAASEPRTSRSCSPLRKRQRIGAASGADGRRHRRWPSLQQLDDGRAVTDLPEPDSPTTPTTVCARMVKFTSSTALP